MLHPLKQPEVLSWALVSELGRVVRRQRVSGSLGGGAGEASLLGVLVVVPVAEVFLRNYLRLGKPGIYKEQH